MSSLILKSHSRAICFHKRRLSAVACLSLWCLNSSPIVAAEGAASPGATAATTDSSGIEEIVVTARRRAESLQDTPIAISAITADSIAARDIDNITQIGDFTPNVKFNSSVPISASNATAAIYIRGIGQNDYQLSADPGVGLYVDGVYISGGVGNILDVLDVERIEVLRGPQGTLFGRNTIGGAVNVITKKPGDQLTGSVDLTTGSYSRRQLKASVDLPLADGVYSNLSVFYHRRDGYVEGIGPGAPDLGGTNQLAGRFALRLQPVSNVTVDLAIDATREREESAPNVAIAIDENATAPQVWNALFSGNGAICANPANPARLTDQRCFNSQWVVGPYRSGGTFTTISPQFNAASGRPYGSMSDLDIWGASGIVEWQLPDQIAFKSISSYRKVVGYWTRDEDHSPATIVETNDAYHQHQYSEELQLTGENFDKRLDWVVGAYYSKTGGDHIDLVNIVDAVFLSGAILDTLSYAGFGQATYEIVPDLKITAGVRDTEDEKTFNNANQYIVDAGFLTGAPLNPDGSPLANGDPLMGPLGQTVKIKNRAVTPMGNLSYRWNPEVLTYISYSEGFKGGGFTQRVFPPLGFIPTFRPEESKTYEVGVKTDLFERRVRINAAAFINNYTDLQITVNDPTLGFAPIIQNAAKARITGFEIESVAKLTENLRLETGVGYLDAKYTDVNLHALSAGVNTGSHLQNAPKWTLSASIAYDLMMANAGKFTPRVDWSYRTTVYNDAVNTPLLVQSGYSLVNASVGYTDPSNHWLFSAGGKNLTGKVYLVSGYTDSFGGVTEGVYGRPREWYVSAGYKF